MSETNAHIIHTICKEGVCPLCEGRISYTYKGHMQEDGVYRWKCPHCGAWGQEGNKTVFDGMHYHVHDSEGNPCEILPPDGKQNLPTLEQMLPLLSEEQKHDATAAIRSILERGFV